MITSSGSTPSRVAQPLAQRARAAREPSHQSSTRPSVLAGHGEGIQRRAGPGAQVQHHLGHAAGQEDAHRRVMRGPFGRTSTSRGTRRLTSFQSSTVGRRSPAAWAMAGMCSSRFVEPPKAAWTTIALRTAASVRMSRVARPRGLQAHQARAERRAMSSQIGWPEGASAECGSDRPSASPTTCEVAAVPRNWQPPPGEAQARQPSSAASSSVSSPWAKRAPMRLDLAGVFAVGRRQRHAAGHEHAGQIAHGRPAPSSSPAGPCRRWRRRGRPCAWAASGSAGGRRWPRRCDRQAVHHARRALRAAVARIGDEAGERHGTRVAPAPRRPPA